MLVNQWVIDSGIVIATNSYSGGDILGRIVQGYIES